jgi:sigma-B regulation protein RsbU (phosphoserine phosphatase)
MSSSKIFEAKKEIKDFKLNVLLEVTNAINDNFSRKELFGIFKSVLQEDLEIGKLILFMYDESWQCAIQYGFSKDALEIDVQKDLMPLKEITYVNSAKEPQFAPFDVIIPVFHKTKPLAFLLIGDIDEARIEISPTIKHRPFIQTLANIIVVAIENKRLAREQIKQEGMKKELELAKEMQELLFPKQLPSNDRIDLSAYYLPHQQVGGDYYDCIKLNEQELVICLADVSGKGIPAAFLMSNFQAYIRTLIKRIPLFYLVQRLNSKVMESAKGEKFITLFIAKYNMQTRVLNYINAGHNPPLLYNEKNTEKITLLTTGCTGLGMLEELPKVDEGIINIDPSSTLLCYTDGAVELENDDGIEFGIQSLEKILLAQEYTSMESLSNQIKESLSQYKGKQPYIDDIALFCCKFL